jgi:hypothetical protein
MKNGVLIGFFLFSTSAFASSVWYSSSAASSGIGSMGNPWNLNIALTNPAATIQPGDTLYLRGGTYHGNFVSTLNNATVRSYPGEWAVVSDGAMGRLTVDINSTTNKASFSGGEFWKSAQMIIIDGETMQLDATAVAGNPINWHINRGWSGSTATAHASNSVVMLKASLIEHTGTNTVFRDFEITSVLTTNRIVGTNRYIGTGLNLAAAGYGNKAINLIIHNVGHPGLGFWEQGAGGEVNGCLMWGNGLYDTDGTWIRGNGIYAQNESGLAKVKNCIFFRNFTFGAKVFGETGPVKDYQYIDNIAFANPGAGQLSAISGSTATSNVWFVGNQILGILDLAYVSTGNTREYVISNTIVAGGLTTKEQSDSVFTNNTIFNIKNTDVSALTTAENGYVSTLLASNQLNITWDYNTWYIGDGSSKNAWHISNTTTNSPWLYWEDWKAASGFDLHSTVATNWPTDYLTVTANVYDYDSNRWNVCVVNTSTATNATLDLSGIGFSPGQRYQLRDAQNYFTVIASGVYSSGTINLPLTLTNVAEIPGVTNFVNQHTDVDQPGLFNAFILSRLSRSGTFTIDRMIVQ